MIRTNVYALMAISTGLIVTLIILGILIAIIVALYFLGKRA